MTVVDDRFDYGEVRRVSAGFLDERMIVIVWTWRGANRHIISMRYCHGKEEKRWREIFRQAGDR
ncbi:MAG TPA: BrnT family toxin [Bradyrhizobium sp.]|nr:BrnT family toxin [Bradyrhizobium sp.]